jgi:hypothetical protein
MARIVWRAGASYTAGFVVEPDVLLFAYEATTAGVSGTTEPVWPTTAGATVTDGTVVWTARAANTITWTAAKLYTSGASEPTWPTTMGATVVGNGVTWTTRSAVISDPKCPHSKIAIKMASKIFSPYRDVMRYSTTNYPRDWSTPDDAGFLPTGLQSSESPEVSACGEYRGRLVVFTPSDLQVWTVDPDPAEMALFDNIPGLGTVFDKAIVAVAGDLYFLTPGGYRSVAVAAGATNLAAGDIGTAIDPVVQVLVAGGKVPIACYYPTSGQMWAIFDNEVWVYSRTQQGKLGTWSQYVFPFTIDSTVQLNNELYLRAEDMFYRLDESVVSDNGVEFEGLIWTPYLEMGSPGTTKMLDSFDIVGYGTCEVSIGYDQNNTTAYTTPFAVEADTVMGGRIPLPLAAPSMAVKIRYLPGQAWQLNSFNLYVNDFKMGT